jgi:hypothetical protein
MAVRQHTARKHRAVNDLQHTPGMSHFSKSVTKDYPDHHDAELALRCYELRRDPAMREARLAMNQKFQPGNAADAIAVTRMDHPLNTAFRQTASYWEMVYALAKHGIVHSDFLLESAGEGLLLYAKMEPWLGELRDQWNQAAFTNAEWISKNSTSGPRLMERFRARIAAGG